MAVVLQPRTDLPQWTDGDDPVTRDQFDAAFAALEQRMALFVQGTVDSRPAVGIEGRFFWATDTKVLFYDDGATWTVAGAGADSGGSSRASTLMLMGV